MKGSMSVELKIEERLVDTQNRKTKSSLAENLWKGHLDTFQDHVQRGTLVKNSERGWFYDN